MKIAATSTLRPSSSPRIGANSTRASKETLHKRAPSQESRTRKWSSTPLKKPTTNLLAKIVLGALALFASKSTLQVTANENRAQGNNLGDGPGYNPGFWENWRRRNNNNCYNYAVNRTTDSFAQPGNVQWPFSCQSVTEAAMSDGLRPIQANASCDGHEVFLGAYRNDFHWWRKDGPNLWTHKPGSLAPRDYDASGKKIKNPLEADLGQYDPCGFFCVEDQKVEIG